LGSRHHETLSLGGGALAAVACRAEGEPRDAAPLRGLPQRAFDEGLKEEAEEVQGEDHLSPPLLLGWPFAGFRGPVAACDRSA